MAGISAERSLSKIYINKKEENLGVARYIAVHYVSSIDTFISPPTFSSDELRR